LKISGNIKEILEWVLCFIIALVVALVLRYYVGTPTIVKMPSMYPTLIENQRLWLNRWDRTTGKMPQRGDIITFEAPSVNFLTSEIADLSSPVAIYNYEPTGLLNRFCYYVLETNKTSYIKRVIALPGEHVELKDGKVYINGEELEEDYLQPGVVTDSAKGVLTDFVVPENCVFAMGDNRSQSTDCRAFGCIPLEKIEGKVSLRFWPLNLFGKVD
jgi:signal peptidase I